MYVLTYWYNSYIAAGGHLCGHGPTVCTTVLMFVNITIQQCVGTSVLHSYQYVSLWSQSDGLYYCTYSLTVVHTTYP